MLRTSLAAAIAALMTVGVSADLYMHNARGSNNRLNEQTATRTNANRLFDSQNNNRGGYNVGDRGSQAFTGTDTQGTAADASYREPAYLYNTANSVTATALTYQMVYYEGSELSMEWTNQHGCGGNEASDPQKLNCDIIIQYMCQTTDGSLVGGKLVPPAAPKIAGAEALRDGANTNAPNTLSDSSDTTTTGTNSDNGHHESEQYYYECSTRSRNKGLFTADQNLNGNSAQYTRQNNNGNRYGLECTEERDYYPYWSPSPWKDVIVMTDHTEVNCDSTGAYVGASQNNNNVYQCMPKAGGTVADNKHAVNSITQATCEATADSQGNAVVAGTWTAFTHGLPAPSCAQVAWSRVNHLGNGRDGQPLMYNWTLPSISLLTTQGAHMFTDAAGSYAKCVVRMRYNITTDDYNPYNTTSRWNNNPNRGVYSPVTGNPTIDIGTGYEGVTLNVNTAQFGRTFQDRSHTFYIRSRPTQFVGGKIYNLNVRGKRGNIVQTFPATEYDFMPSRLSVTSADWVHVQWTGSNTHNNGGDGGDGQAGDAGEGRDGTDRHNIAQLMNFNENYPQPLDKFVDNMWSRSQCFSLSGAPLTTASTPNGDISTNTAALDCSVYLTTVGQFASAQAVTNAAKATTSTVDTEFDPLLDNSGASLVGGVVMQFTPAAGTTPKSYDYMCTRNNNFSNRGQKGTLIVVS